MGENKLINQARCTVEKKQLETYEKIKSMQQHVNENLVDYWHSYSGLDTWQFWIILILFFLLPLVSVFFFIDGKNKLLIGFYGFNIHVWFGYIDRIGSENGYWGYPYKIFPFIPGNVSLDAALVPILFMYVYQWTLKTNKNFYIYSIGLSVFLSFVFKPIINMHELFKMHKGINFLHLFMFYCIIFIFSKIITNIFMKLPLRKEQKLDKS